MSCNSTLKHKLIKTIFYSQSKKIITMKKEIFLFVIFSALFLGNINAQSQILAQKFATAAANRTMQKISPNTGHSASAYMYKAEFDYSQSHYLIDMSATWTAKATMFWSDEKTFEVRGILEVDKSGKIISFDESYRNDAVKSAWTDDQIGLAFGTALAVTAAISESSSNNNSYAASNSSSNSSSEKITLYNKTGDPFNYEISYDGVNYYAKNTSSYTSTSYSNNGNKLWIRVKTYSAGNLKETVSYSLKPNNTFDLYYDTSKGRFDVD
jgi:hypothetical protein